MHVLMELQASLQSWARCSCESSAGYATDQEWVWRRIDQRNPLRSDMALVELLRQAAA